MLGAIAIPAVQRAYCMHPTPAASHTTQWNRAEFIEHGAEGAAKISRVTTCGVCGKTWSR
jgi:hypothetical protein